jgi:hypothetical protein
MEKWNFLELPHQRHWKSPKLIRPKGQKFDTFFIRNNEDSQDFLFSKKEGVSISMLIFENLNIKNTPGVSILYIFR